MRSVRVGRTRRVVLAFLVLAGLGAVLVLQGEAGATLHQTSDTAPLGAVSTVWSRDLSRFDTDNPIAQSSPVVAMVDGTADAPLPAVVVGDRAGYLYAADLATGRLRTLYTSPAPIDSPPSAASPTGSGFDDVFFGRGNRGVACRLSDGTYGGYTAVSAAGTLLWKRWVNNPVGDTLCPHNGVMGGMTLFNDASGTLDTIGMSLGQSEHGFVAATGAPLAGWNPWFQADSSISTPAIAHLGKPTGALSLIEGGDSTAGLAYGGVYQNGGHVRVVSTNGNGGTPGFGGTKCSYNTYANGGQIVESSPAVGPFLPGGTEGIVSGQGYFSAYGGSPNRIFAMNKSCSLIWSHKLDHETSSPILADVNGDGTLDVIVGTQDISVHGNPEGGAVWAFDGATGAVLWHVPTGAVVGSPVAADLRGTEHADVVVETTSSSRGGLMILDGKTGATLFTDSAAVGQDTPLVTADANGTIGITLAGYHGVLVNSQVHLAGDIVHYEIAGSDASWLSHPITSWLEFHHDPRLTGNTSGPTP